MTDHKLRWKLRGASLLLAACCATVICARSTAQDEAGGSQQVSALVTTAALRQGAIASTVSGYGTVVAVPGQARSLTFAQAGLVADLRVGVGAVVKRGATLLTLVTDPAGRLVYEQARTGLDLARSELGRIRALRAQNLATDSQVATAEKNLHDAEATLVAQRQLGTAAAVSDLKAPFDGTVLELPVAAGDRAAAGAVLARMLPAAAMQVLIGLAPADARAVRVGMAATLQTISSQAPIAGRVSQVQAVLNPQSHLVDVAVQPLAAADAAGLLPAEAAQATITLATSNALLVPRAAVLRDAAGAYLFQVVDGHAKRVSVSTAAETENEVAVSGALDPARKVVVLGAYELEDGMAVHEAAAANPHGAEDQAGKRQP